MLAENFAEQDGGRRKAGAIIRGPRSACALGKGGAATRARGWSRLTALSEYGARRRDDNAVMRNLTQQMVKDFI